jgi:hypothetical protein
MPALIELPREVLDEIAQSLCQYCTPSQREGDEKLRPWPYENDNPDQEHEATCAASRALARLGLTCRQLNAVATPHLYHRPACSNRWLLIRTLIARPDLALCVRHLCDFALGDPTMTNRLDPFFLRPVPPEVASHFENLILNRFLAHREAELGWYRWERAETLNMMASLCLNVEQIVAGALGPDMPFSWSVSNSLTRLKDLALQDWNAGGMPLERLARIGTTAPRLTRLLFSLAIREPFQMQPLALPTFAHLVDLTLQGSCLPAQLLPHLLAACPNLRSFAYWAYVVYDLEEGVAHITPRQAQDVLVRHAPSLVSLTLHTIAGDTTSNSPTTVMRFLAGLSKLEHLGLDPRWLLPNVHNGQPVPELGPMALVDLLPASIRSLRLAWIDTVNLEFRLLSAALARLASVLRERIPGLEKVAVSGLQARRGPEEKEVQEVSAAFERQGIKVSIDRMPHKGY